MLVNTVKETRSNNASLFELGHASSSKLANQKPSKWC